MTLVAAGLLLTLAAAHPGWWSIPLILAAVFCLLSAFIPNTEG